MVLTQEYLKTRLKYNQQTGIFTWIKCRKPFVGRKAGSINGHGYVGISLCGKTWLAHRLAFIYMEGSAPKYVDHKNREKSDNRWCNLRATTNAQNGANSRIKKSNTSGFRGVCFDKRSGKWHARIGKNGRQKHLGYFECKQEAYSVYSKASVKEFGQFSNV